MVTERPVSGRVPAASYCPWPLARVCSAATSA